MPYVFLSLAVVFNIGANIMFKIISDQTNGLSWYLMFGVGLAFGGVNAFFLSRALKTIDLNIAYPVFSAACIAFMVVVSLLVFQEKMGLLNLAGIFLIIGGIVLVAQ